MIKLVKDTREYIVEGVVGVSAAEEVVRAIMRVTRTEEEMKPWEFSTHLMAKGAFKVFAFRTY